jgi:hypothetical protein
MKNTSNFQDSAIVAVGAVREAVGASRLAEAVVAVSKADGETHLFIHQVHFVMIKSLIYSLWVQPQAMMPCWANMTKGPLTTICEPECQAVMRPRLPGGNTRTYVLPT